MPWFRSLAALLLIVSLAVAGDWPQWLGPNRDGSSAEKVQPWKGELKIAWRQPVGEGHSSPVVADGCVYLHFTVKGKDSEAVECFDAATGNKVWSYEYARGAFKGLFGNGPRGTPAVTGGKVYAYGATGFLTCLDAKKGTMLWQVETKKDFNPPPLRFGVSSSPLVAGDKVLVAVGAKGASVVAFDKDSGKVRWKSLDDKASYSSPILIGPASDPTAVFLTQKGLAGLRVADGSPQCSFPFEDKLAESSTTPVRVGNKLLISSVTLGSALLSLDDKKPTKEWMKSDLTCYFSTPVAVMPDHVYMVTGTPLGGQAVLHCVEAKTGTSLWQKAGVGKYHASLLLTGDGKLLMVEEAGNLVMLEPNPSAYRELARAKICGNTWAHPALADGKLYIRDDKEVVCVALGK